MAKDIVKRQGDVFWSRTHYRIGSPDSSASGRIGTMSEKTVTYDEISEATGSRNPYDLMANLECQMRLSSRFNIKRRNKKVRLEHIC